MASVLVLEGTAVLLNGFEGTESLYEVTPVSEVEPVAKVLETGPLEVGPLEIGPLGMEALGNRGGAYPEPDGDGGTMLTKDSTVDAVMMLSEKPGREG
jgi:hypothetical protein